MMQKKPLSPYVKFVPLTDRVRVDFGYTIFFAPPENGKVSCYIPGFDISLSAPDKQEAFRRANVVVRSFMNHFIEHSPKEKKIKLLVLELNKLGFKAPTNDVAIKNILNGRISGNPKFKNSINNVPSGFNDVEIHSESLSEVA